MKKTILAAITFMLALGTSIATAQEQQSLTVGVSPVGSIHANISLDNEEYKYNYESYWNVNLGYEGQFHGHVTLTEVTYAKAKFESYELTGNSQWFNPAQQEDVTDIALTTYYGRTIFPGKRVQLPLYIGIGGEYIKGGPLHNLAFDVAAKARLKFYISNSFGIYAGATGRWGFGAKSASEKSSSSTKMYSVIPSTLAFDAGIIISL